MKILLTGATGQVGYELQRSLQGLGEVVAVDRARMNLADLEHVRSVVRSVRPNLIVNPAAYTAVDKAESEPALARTVNALAPAVMAEEAKALGAAMVHFSTDYVFDGNKDGAYRETDAPNPLSVYGTTKLEGEQAVAAAGIPHLILRTSWVYGMRGKNFLLTMLKLAAERSELRIVNDQFGAPTWSRTIADVTAHLLSNSSNADWWAASSGLYHLSSRGATNWSEFAEKILQRSGNICPVVPISTRDYPTAAVRPANSRLVTAKIEALAYELPHWTDALDSCLSENCHD